MLKVQNLSPEIGIAATEIHHFAINTYNMTETVCSWVVDNVKCF